MYLLRYISAILGLVLFVSNPTVSAQNFSDTTLLRKHITYLASDELEGRMAGSDGDSMAAFYIRNEFRKYGLQLIGKEGFQYFSLVTDINGGPDNAFSVNEKSFAFGKDFMPFSFSTSATLSGDVVFAGFGISGQSGQLEWDDFAGLDLRNKWVIALRGDPEPDSTSSAFIPMATDRAKALAVKDRGAAGLLLVSPSSIEKKDAPIELSFDKSVSDAGLPVISITRALTTEILQLPLTGIDSIEKVMISRLKPVSFPVNARIQATTDVVREKKVSRNIMALAEGTDPLLKNEYIVVGAHYDHLGMGGLGSGSRVPEEHAVHGGADDNASGVASLLELARWYAQPSHRQPRSLLFISFAGEEMGLLGSRYLVGNFPLPLTQVKGMVNLDMVGRLSLEEGAAVSLSGTGTFRQADSLLSLLDNGLSFRVTRSPEGFGPSDHAAFYGEDIPVLFITTGVHDDYHTPADRADKINYAGQAEVTAYVNKLVDGLATMNPAPAFLESGSRKQAGRYGRGLKVALGIMPDVSGAETAGGMKIEGVRKDGPAAIAGMMKGDVIININGLSVTNIYEYMGRLGKLNPGDRANIEIVRNGKPQVMIVQL